MDSKEFVDAQMDYNNKTYKAIEHLADEVANLKERILDLEALAKKKESN